MTSPLAGKLFDETGDRLTPSHSRTANGTRLRHYVSHRLVSDSKEVEPPGWRLPAPELERQVAALVRAQVADRALWFDACRSGAAIGTDTRERLDRPRLARRTGEEMDDAAMLVLIDRADIAPGRISVRLDRERLAQAVGIDPETLDDDQLRLDAPFRQRRRGVEQKLIIGDAAASPDETLIRNLGRAHAWFAELRAGRSYAEIATRAETSKRRVMQLVELAFLAPDLTAQILDGRQPAALTTDLLIRQEIPEDWPAQRRLFDSLRRTPSPTTAPSATATRAT